MMAGVMNPQPKMAGSLPKRFTKLGSTERIDLIGI
jgi:hypothetical protein